MKLKTMVSILILLATQEAFTARPSEPVKKTIILSEVCSAELTKWLGLTSNEVKEGLSLPTISGAWTPNGLQTKIVTNLIEPSKTHPKQLTVGPDWWHLGAAIPRREGPNLQFQSAPTESPESLPGGWQKIVIALKKGKPVIGRPFGSGKILFESSLCKGKDFSILITLVETPDGHNITGSAGTPGAPVNQYSVLFRAGEHISALASDAQ